MKRVVLCAFVGGLILILGGAAAIALQLKSRSTPRFAFDPYNDSRDASLIVESPNWQHAEPAQDIRLVSEQFGAQPAEPPRFDPHARFDGPDELVADVPTPAFASPPTFATPPAGSTSRDAPSSAPSEPEEATDLAEGMAYVIRVHRQGDKPAYNKVFVQRNYGGKYVSVIDLTSQLTAPESLRIFAEAVSLDTENETYHLRCQGNVVVVAQQSMIKGTDLEYSDGQFTLVTTEIVTPDATISTGESEFAFQIGAIAVESIVDDNGDNESGPDVAAPEASPTPPSPESSRFESF